MSPLPRQGWLFLIEFLKWYFSKYWQVRTRPVFAQTVTYTIVWVNFVSKSNVVMWDKILRHIKL